MHQNNSWQNAYEPQLTKHIGTTADHVCPISQLQRATFIYIKITDDQSWQICQNRSILYTELGDIFITLWSLCQNNRGMDAYLYVRPAIVYVRTTDEWYVITTEGLVGTSEHQRTGWVRQNNRWLDGYSGTKKNSVSTSEQRGLDWYVRKKADEMGISKQQLDRRVRHRTTAD